MSGSNAGHSGLSPGLYTRISVSDKVYEDQCPLHCYPVYQSVTQGIVACLLNTRISVSDKVYKDLPATLYSDVSFNKLGALGVCRSTGILVSDKVYEYTKTCQLHCSPVYQSVTCHVTACHPDCFLVYFVADRHSLVYTLGNRPLYTGLLTDIPGSSAQCSLQVFIYFVADRYSGIHSRRQASIQVSATLYPKV